MTMKTHDHAAQLAAEIREMLKNSADTFQDGQGIILTQDAEALESALAAWDKHNAPAPKQEALL